MGAYAMAGLGLVGSIAGGFLGAKAAKTRQKRLESLANTPGLDIGAITKESLLNSGANFGLAENLTNRINQSTALGQRNLLESSLPGYQSRKEKELSIVDSYLRGEVPEDVQRQLFDSAAGRALEGGFAGSGLGRNLTARDFGLTSLGLMNAGMDRTGQINAQTAALEMPEMVNVANYLGLNPAQLTGLRSNERTQRLGLLSGAINSPSGKDVWAKTLTDLGGAALGGGASMLGKQSESPLKRPTSGSYTDYLGYGG